MSMTDEEILSAAARLRAARRRRVAKACEVCGTPFKGIAQRRYCSDACRVRASRARRGGRTTAVREEASLPPPGANESTLNYRDRVGDDVMRDRVSTKVSTELDEQEHVESATNQLRIRATVEMEHLLAEGRRREGESSIEHLRRIRDVIGQCYDPDDDSTQLLRESRDERTAALFRASGVIDEEPEPPAPRGEGESLMDYLARVRAYMMGDHRR